MSTGQKFQHCDLCMKDDIMNYFYFEPLNVALFSLPSLKDNANDICTDCIVHFCCYILEKLLLSVRIPNSKF